MSTVFALGEAARPVRRRGALQRVFGDTPSAWLYVLPAVVIIIGANAMKC